MAPAGGVVHRDAIGQGMRQLGFCIVSLITSMVTRTRQRQ